MLPSEYSTTDSACWPWVRALLVLPRRQPSCSTLSATVAARPVTVVPLSTATVIVFGLGAAVLWLWCEWELPLLLLPPELDESAAVLPELLSLLVSCETPYAAPAPSTRMPTTISAI